MAKLRRKARLVAKSSQQQTSAPKPYKPARLPMYWTDERIADAEQLSFLLRRQAD